MPKVRDEDYRVRENHNQIVVRAGIIWFGISAASIALDVFFIVQFGAGGGSFVDALGTSLIAGALASVTSAIATSRMIFRTTGFVAIGAFRTYMFDASQVAGLDDQNGLSVILHSGREVNLTTTEPSLAQLLLRNTRRKREASRIRNLLAIADGDKSPGWKATECTIVWRMSAVYGVLLFTFGSIGISVGLNLAGS
jgi:hypothetical protein